MWIKPTKPTEPRWPLYIPSKGRAEHALTPRFLQRMSVGFFLVIEEQEHDAYAEYFPAEQLLVLDPRYQEQYEACDRLGMSKPKGAGAARNFAWDHAIALGAKWHWVMDDNIRGFVRLNRNIKKRVADGCVFRCMEDFCARYRNVAMAGPNYAMFAPRKAKMPPFVRNTRIYSCNLIRNDVPFRWRGRYNEDTILSLDMLKAGWCTVQFNAFLQEKMNTQKMPGGNTDTLYKDGTVEKSEMLARVHPDVSRVAYRYGRVHHYVNYSGFRQRLVRRADSEIKRGVDNYGMRLVSDHGVRGPTRGTRYQG